MHQRNCSKIVLAQQYLGYMWLAVPEHRNKLVDLPHIWWRLCSDASASLSRHSTDCNSVHSDVVISNHPPTHSQRVHAWQLRCRSLGKFIVLCCLVHASDNVHSSALQSSTGIIDLQPNSICISPRKRSNTRKSATGVIEWNREWGYYDKWR